MNWKKRFLKPKLKSRVSVDGGMTWNDVKNMVFTLHKNNLYRDIIFGVDFSNETYNI